MKLLISAMTKEVEKIIFNLKLNKSNDIFDNKYDIYESTNNDLLLVVSKIGLVNAAGALSHILTKYQNEITEVINLGCVCSIDKEINQGDIVYVDKGYYALADATAFNYKYGQIPQEKEFYESNSNLIKKYTSNIKNIKKVNIASSDIFITDPIFITDNIYKINDKISIIDMECTSYMQICNTYNIPFLSIKIISDNIYSSDNKIEYEKYVNIISDKIYNITKNHIINS